MTIIEKMDNFENTSEELPEYKLIKKKAFIKIPLGTNEFQNQYNTLIKFDDFVDHELNDFGNHTHVCNKIIHIKNIKNPTNTSTNILNIHLNSIKDENSKDAIRKKLLVKSNERNFGYTKIDNFFFDILMPKIASPSASMIYLFLFRRSLGFHKYSVKMSHQTIAESVGLSKRAVQNALLLLNKLNIIKSSRTHKTAIPEHFIIRLKESESGMQFIENTEQDELAIAENDECYGKIFHRTIADFATFKKKEEIKILNNFEISKT